MRLRTLFTVSALVAVAGAAQGQVPAPARTSIRPNRTTAGAAGSAAVYSRRLLAAGLVIGTDSTLPPATVGAPYSQTLLASGGSQPYSWATASGALPPGVTLDASGLLSGTPAQFGAFSFTVTVTDNAGGSASKVFSLLAILPPTPTLSFTGLPNTATPAEQLVFDIQLSAAYSRDITGSITLTFKPNAVNQSDDPSIQFSTGGRTLNFTVPAGQTSASWSSTHALQTGTVAGQITLTLKFSAGGQDITPLFTPASLITIAKAAPQIDSVQMVRTSSGLQVTITGFSTPREVTSATFSFTTAQGGSTQAASVEVSVNDVFDNWYTGASATQFGSVFVYTQPFTVRGNVGDITSVSVTLTNSTSTSSAVSATF